LAAIGGNLPSNVQPADKSGKAQRACKKLGSLTIFGLKK
jgi:hypothetical protein